MGDFRQISFRFVWIALAALALAVSASACSPRFNREGKQRAATQPLSSGIAYPVVDLNAQGGSASLGVTQHFRVSRVSIGGGIRKLSGATSSGLSAQGGVGAPQ